MLHALHSVLGFDLASPSAFALLLPQTILSLSLSLSEDLGLTLELLLLAACLSTRIVGKGLPAGRAPPRSVATSEASHPGWALDTK